jgi:hypothetical protein
MSRPSIPKLWPGSTIVCVGTGPSLTQGDLASVKGRARVIAINDAVRWAPWADVLYACDGKWVNQFHGMPKFAGLKYSLTVNLKHWPTWTRLRNDGALGLCLEPSGLRTGHNSGYQAINLAVHLGARRILLLGYDMMRHSGKSHFFGEHPPGWTPSPYPQFLRAFASLPQPLAQLGGVQVINCSRVTALKVFPQQSLEDALPARDLEMAG